MTVENIKIKDIEIPITIKSYKNAKTIKIYFKGNNLTITKPKRFSNKKLTEILKENEDDIYSKYIKICESKMTIIKQWQTGEFIYYKGEKFIINRQYTDKQKIIINIDEKQKEIIIIVPKEINQEEIKTNVDKAIKKIFKVNTEHIISKRLPYWSKITELEYNQVKIRDAITRYGSCMPSKKNIYFSSRLIMLPEYVIDAIIVHELCHLKYKNHSKEFYELVSKYIPNYKDIDKWLKINGKIILF